MNNILIVKTSSLGDIIHAFPVVNFLKSNFPDCTIDWVVEKNFKELVEVNSLVNQSIEMDTKGWRKQFFKTKTWKNVLGFFKKLRVKNYDLVIDLQGNTKSTIATFFARSPHKLGFGSKTVHEWPNLLVTNLKVNPPLHLNVREENLYLVQHHFNRWETMADQALVLKLNDIEKKTFNDLKHTLEAENRKKVLVCPGSAWKNKQMSDEGLKDLLRQVEKENETKFYFIWGDRKEKSYVESLQREFKDSFVLDKLGLALLQNVMASMDLIIAMDSLPLHLAGTTDVETWGVFGASSAEKYKPIGPQHKAFQGSCPYGVSFERRCPKLRSCSTGACIQGLKGKDVYTKLRS